MLDHFKGMGVGSVPSVQDPGVVVDRFCVCVQGGCLDDHKSLVEEDLGDCGAGHEGIFVEEDGLVDIRPVYLVN